MVGRGSHDRWLNYYGFIGGSDGIIYHLYICYYFGDTGHGRSHYQRRKYENTWYFSRIDVPLSIRTGCRDDFFPYI